MGMTIDKAIPKIQFVRNALNDDMEIAKVYELAIDTMRKYQKIQEIIADWKSDGGAFEMSELYWLRLISEVIEDGKEER